MDLQSLINETTHLPSSPEILPKLQTLLRDGNADAQDIVKLIRIDTSLAAQVVRMANSAAYGGTERIEGLSEAIQRLGFKQVFRVITVAASSRLLGMDLPVYRLTGIQMMERAAAAATLLAALANARREVPVDTAYTTGLMHGIGKVAINAFYLKRGLEFYDLQGQFELDPELERRALGFDFAEAGAALLERWKFSTQTVAAVRGQRLPALKSADPILTALLQLTIQWAEPLLQGLEAPEEPLLDKAIVGPLLGKPEEYKRAYAAAKIELDALSEFVRSMS